MERVRPGAESQRGSGRVAARSAVAPAADASNPPPELRAVIDAMPEAVLVCDPRDQVRIVNPAADRLFAGRPVQDAGDLLSRFDAVPSSEQPADGSMTLRPRTIPNRWFELRTFPVLRAGGPRPAPQDLGAAAHRGPAPDRGPAVNAGPAATDRTATDGGRIIVLRDVTSALEERAERRAFLSILSHELRTPITTIYAGSRVLARRDPTRAQATQEIARDISAEAARLYDVVEDLLVLTRAEQGLLELSEEPILLQRIVEGAVRVASGRNPEVPIVVEGATDPGAVAGDAVYVEQIVRNLVTAATRFGGPDSPVVVRLAEGVHDVSLEVLDRGPALSSMDLERSFALSDDSSIRASGIGISLFVCRRLVEAMNGRVWVRAAEDGGAIFGFALPRYDPE